LIAAMSSGAEIMARTEWPVEFRRLA